MTFESLCKVRLMITNQIPFNYQNIIFVINLSKSKFIFDYWHSTSFGNHPCDVVLIRPGSTRIGVYDERKRSTYANIYRWNHVVGQSVHKLFQNMLCFDTRTSLRPIHQIVDNKSNSTRLAMQVEANLQELLSDYLQFWPWKCRSRSQSMAFAMQIFDSKYKQSTKVICDIFASALTVFKILAFEIFDLEEVGQGDRVLFLQWRHSMKNIKICKSCMRQFFSELSSFPRY